MTANRVLYLFGSAAPPVLDIAGVIERAKSADWDVCFGLTPTAARWLDDDLPALEELMGVRVLYGEGGFVPNKPGQGRPENYPWHLALEAAASVVSTPVPPTPQ
ncbi:hypothetical protein ABVG11_14370 [Streptomyces sp. HD1123-B1]|uniref:hypothetical protein n=1 Tax=Streptomyces huangiella TaxID=3228804 RepID=UPI003D7D4644